MQRPQSSFDGESARLAHLHPRALVWVLTLARSAPRRHALDTRAGRSRGAARCPLGDALERVGLFDEAYFMSWERISRGGSSTRTRGHRVPTVEVLHHGLQSTAEVRAPDQRCWLLPRHLLARYHSRWRVGSCAGSPAGVRSARRREVVRRLPARFHPAGARLGSTVYRFHVRDAFRGTRDPSFAGSPRSGTGGMRESRHERAERGDAPAAERELPRHVLTIVVPVYNGGEDIVENVAVSGVRRPARSRPKTSSSSSSRTDRSTARPSACSRRGATWTCT